MNFYMVFPRQAYAGYMGKSGSDESAIEAPKPPRKLAKWKAPILVEYLGDPPTKPKKQGDYHAGGWVHLFSERAIDVLDLGGLGVWLQVNIEGRKEQFYRYWNTQVVDCLDFERSTISEAGTRGKIGVIKRLAIDERNWDGSPLFGVPNDPNFEMIASEEFVEICQAHRLRGIEFRKEFFDDQPISI